jgi:hypothetical protein
MFLCSFVLWLLSHGKESEVVSEHMCACECVCAFGCVGVWCVVTPDCWSTWQSIKDAATPRSVGTPRVPRPENPCEAKTYAVGYAGFVPGTYVLHNTPDRYKPKTSTPMDIALATPGSIYLGDLTQEWNVGAPYRRSYESYGSFSPLAQNEEGKPRLWTRRK